MKNKIISITIEEELLEMIDNICRDYSARRKSKMTRSELITNALLLFLIACSNEQNKKNKEETKEEIN